TPTTTAPPQPAPNRSGVPDFHRAVSFLREHPAVLRSLGLIFDVRLPAAELDPQGSVQVLWRGSDLVESPWTRYELDGTDFLPASTERIRSGMVDLGATVQVETARGVEEARWETANFDVDSAVGRLRDTARGLSADEDEPVTLPALRSTGPMLLRHGREHDLTARHRAAEAMATLDGMADAELTADDLVLGYRIDVQSSSGGWMSLARRLATYFVGEEAIGVPNRAEEGQIKPHAMRRDTKGGALLGDEVVACWDGWSHVLPRPSLLAANANGAAANPLIRLPYEIRWTFLRDGILPELRFGRAYQLRARIADVTGGGLRLNEPVADTCASLLVPYRRHEPLPPPQLALTTGPLTPQVKLGPGGTPTQLVIRSDRGLTAAQFAERHPHYEDNDSRVLLPPPTSRELAEQHGVLDGADARTWELVRRVVVPSDDAFLPDPTADGVTFCLLRSPGDTQPLADRRPWGGQWPDLTAKLLVLGERPGPAIGWEPAGLWGPDDRVVFRLAPAEQVTVEISSNLDSSYANHFVIREWAPPDQDGGDPALGGRHPMVTPPVVVTLVHAVRRPRKDPDGQLVAVRERGETFATLRPVDPLNPLLSVDPASTIQLDLVAGWDEWHDDGVGNPTSFARPASAALPPAHLERDATHLPPLRQEFGDTRRRTITYTATAVSRFRQFFDDADPEAFLAEKPLGPVTVRSSARPAPPAVLSTTPSFRWEGLAVPTGWESLHRTRSGGRLRVELARPWYTTGEGEQLAVVVWPGDPPGDVPEAAHPFVSRLNRDPIWATPAPVVALKASALSGFSGPRPRSVSLPELGREVIAVPYEVWFNDGRWYADIDLSAAAASSYRPFAQLALGRYQPESLPDLGLELSPVVLTEMVQPLPDRALTVERGSGELRVLLEGTGPLGPLPNRVHASVETCAVPTGANASEVDLTLSGEPAEGVRAWTRVPGLAVSGGLGSPLHSLPLPLGTGSFRLVVRETERYPASPDAPPSAEGVPELMERSVFIDAVPL
ncbi:hypothetical protein, partial [Streptomyces lunaelactis]